MADMKIHLNIDGTLYKRIKATAALEGTTVKDLVEKLLTDYASKIKLG